MPKRSARMALALRLHDRGRSLALAFPDFGASREAHHDENNNQCHCTLFHVTHALQSDCRNGLDGRVPHLMWSSARLGKCSGPDRCSRHGSRSHALAPFAQCVLGLAQRCEGTERDSTGRGGAVDVGRRADHDAADVHVVVADDPSSSRHVASSGHALGFAAVTSSTIARL